MIHKHSVVLLCALGWAVPLTAQSQDPLSAIDWLSESVATIDDTPLQAAPTDEEPVTQSGAVPRVTTTPLGEAERASVGLLSPDVTGLPRDLWSGSTAPMLAQLISADGLPSLPALKDFTTVLMLAEADAPLASDADHVLLLARVDKLLSLGRLEEAKSLLEASDPDTPALFRRWFDVALLTGTEDRACAVMDVRPTISPTVPASIFCLARNGDWNAAALTLNTSSALGDISAEEKELLSRFLDADAAEGEARPRPPANMTPLTFRIFEAIGEGTTTAGLPLAFAHADLRDTSGWKARLDAAERLTRNGALSPNVIQSLYTARTPAASGGIWDRAEAFSRFDASIKSGDPTAIARALPAAWDAATEARIRPAFALLYASDLARLPLTGEAERTAITIGLLSPDYEGTALRAASGQIDPALARIARGQNAPALSDDMRLAAVQRAFSDATPPARLTSLTAEGKLGEAILRAISMIEAGLAGDPAAVTDGLSFLRSVGLEDVARRTALQYILLEEPS